jgi:hypothetical protein
MLRRKLLLTASLGALACAALGLDVSPGFAQFGTIFGGPPRPPADIPQSPPPGGGDDRFYSARQQQNVWPRDPRVVAPPPGGYPPPPPGGYPPSQGYPQQGYPQQGYPPPPPGYPQQYPPQQAGRPPGVQQQDLPPPPGVQQSGVNPSLPGLPPGQRQPRGTPGDTPTTPAPQNDEVVIEPPAQKIPNQQAVFSGLDKITGRIISFDVAINETVQFGALQVTPRVCYTRPPTETPNTDSFIEVDEITLQGEIKRLFTGWMFAASPGLNAIEHPIYDVWLADCKGPQAPAVADAGDATQPAPTRPAQRPQQRAKQPAQPKAALPRPQQPAQQLPPPPQSIIR